MKHCGTIRCFGADAQMCAWNTRRKFGKILAAHGTLRQADDLFIAKDVACGCDNLFKDRRIAFDHTNTLQEFDIDLCPGGGADAFGDACDGILGCGADVFGMGADRALKGHRIGDLVACGTAFDFSDRDHRRVKGGDFPGNDILDLGNELGRSNNGINGKMRMCPVTGKTGNRYIKWIGGRKGDFGVPANRTAGKQRPIVIAQHDIGFVFVKDTIGKHRPCAAKAFFCRLEQDQGAAFEIFTKSCQNGGNAKGDGSVGIMSASMHDPLIFRGKGKPGFFGDR
eukprot:NODE_3022_length_953_cov_1.279661_g3002_i0.p2 GENE.NODE_3022_length_953_cov_1.279661_g3002_i0~~NODE_3022_length_953_cov_1.279661_g3002_i0.p2  ORF type:complete len:282 (+),score=33.77 NODE_3022_length_953_cov_1.279661_g3002_i0:1-846(+)